MAKLPLFTEIEVAVPYHDGFITEVVPLRTPAIRLTGVEAVRGGVLFLEVEYKTYVRGAVDKLTFVRYFVCYDDILFIHVKKENEPRK